MALTDGVVNIDDYLFEDAGEEKVSPADEPISVDDAVSSLAILVEDAADFITSEMMPEWEAAEKYYDGETDLPKIPGRSQATETAVRDAIRGAKNAVLRSLVGADRILDFETSSAAFSDLARIQSRYVEHLFWSNNGYRVLLDVVQDALAKKVGVMSVRWEEDYSDNHLTASGITAETLQGLQQNRNISVTSVEELDYYEVPLYNVEFTYTQPLGKICLEHVPLYEFFISENAISTADARVVGRRRSIPIGDCIRMGLEYDDWESLDSLDPEEYEASGESQYRRGYVKDSLEDSHEKDPMMKRILLTEVYARFDLDGTGIPQLYCFWLGGTSYELIDYEKVHEVPLHAFLSDPQPAAFFGKSIYDIMKEMQDVSTSLLRATVDNAHLSNNRRLAVHETMVNMGDVLSPKIGHPIRVRAPGMIQEIATQSTAGAMLPILEYLNRRGEIKSGVTSAALGLDPDSMQSTNQDAIRNTIEAAKGQTEYYTRNIAETGLASVFRHLLNLSIRHFDPTVEFMGLQINQAYFMPDLPVNCKVGLGNADRMEKITFLDQMIQYQMQIFQQLGLANPYVTSEQHFNAMEDKAQLMGFPNLSRYMNRVDPQTTQQFMQELMQRQQPPPQPDPTAAMVEVEKIKAQADAAEKELEATLEEQKLAQQQQNQEAQIRARMTEILMNDDLKRDEMLQRLYIEAAKLNAENLDREEVRKVQAVTQAKTAQMRERSNNEGGEGRS